jgi:hypothetical protein
MLKLYIGKQFTGVTLEPDTRYPWMWYICKGEQQSHMVNLTRAKDAAITWARPKGLGGHEVVSWRTGKEARSARPFAKTVAP